MVLAMLAEAVVCLEERVVREPRDLDIALVLGAGFPAFRGGLLRHADDVGIAVVSERLNRLAEAHGERFRPAETLRALARDGRKFHG
jgi:3-hydroxyacyl-CoA dehydrogenase/enoyl-CoA hydratase/3-hydroxybutyryl-CoA epimerase